MAMRTVYRVAPSRDGWELFRGNAKLEGYGRQEDAVAAGREAARADRPSQLVVHGTDGRIEDEATYSDDPFPPAG